MADAKKILFSTQNDNTSLFLPRDVSWSFAGEANDQAESQAFLTIAFSGALGLMFVILLAQFNSFYNSILVLLAVIYLKDLYETN